MLKVGRTNPDFVAILKILTMQYGERESGATGLAGCHSCPSSQEGQPALFVIIGGEYPC